MIAHPALLGPVRIIGHGIDLVEVDRIREMLARHRERFLERCFTPDEAAYSKRRPTREAEHLAARFAAKEAVVKVLGTGRRHGIAWPEIGVVRLPTGQPTVRLTGTAADIARQLGISSWFLSLSHVPSHATASAIGCATV